MLSPNDADLVGYMKVAIKEASISLKEGNHGFGAVIIQNGKIIAQAHDTEETDQDPTAHAELKAIRTASSQIGKSLDSCMLISTHEPCPMCATAIVWSKLPFLAFGFSIADSIRQTRNRIDIECVEIFRRAQADIHVNSSLQQRECAVLYDREVRAEIKRLKGASDIELYRLNNESKKKRVHWFQTEMLDSKTPAIDPLEHAYHILLLKLDIQEDQAPIINKTDKRIVFHSMNTCPTLEACKILGLDTRKICKLYNEESTNALIKQVDSRLVFIRNYSKIRPYVDYCEEIIMYST